VRDALIHRSAVAGVHVLPEALACLCLICWSAQSAFSIIHEVIPGDCVQDTVNAASPGDTIIMYDGAYAATVVLYGKSLTIASPFLLDGDTSHITQTVISPDNLRPDTGSCFVYAYFEPPPSRLIGLTLVNGTGTYWSNAQGYAGGAVYIHRAELEIRSCRIQNSAAEMGGGVAAIGNPNLHDANLVIRDAMLSECSSMAWGGGVYANWCTLAVRNSNFSNDISVQQSGGAISALATYAEIDSVQVVGCTGVVGGIELFDGGYVANSLFEDNGSTQMYWSTDLALNQSTFVVFNNVFLHNASLSRSIRFCCEPDDYVAFLHNVVADNVGTTASGTILLAGVRGEVGYNLIQNNGGSPVGVLYGYQGSDMRVHHNVITGSFAADSFGCVFLAGPNSHVTLDSNVISGNRGQTINYVNPLHTTIDARNNWWGSATGPYHPTLNPAGQGDTLLSDSVLFIPFLTEPPDTTMPPDYLTAPRQHPEISRTWELMDVFPNPFNQSITLVLAGFTGGDFEISLYNLLGQQVDVVHRGPLTGGRIIYQAPPHLASGVYLLSASDQHDVQTQKVILLK
jgi:hypothetical protein